MDVFEAIRTRRSIRKYQNKPFPWDHMVTILEAGKYAPCAGNILNWKFTVVKNEGNRAAIAKACNQEWMADAPVHIVVVAEPMKAERFYGTRGARTYTVQGAAASMENMILTAHSLGLGTCWVGAFDDDELFRILKLSEETSVQGIITIGYPAENPPPPPKHRIEHIFWIERWGGRIEAPKTYIGWWSVWNMQMVDAAKKGIKKLHGKVKDKINSKKKK